MIGNWSLLWTVFDICQGTDAHVHVRTYSICMYLRVHVHVMQELLKPDSGIQVELEHSSLSSARSLRSYTTCSSFGSDTFASEGRGRSPSAAEGNNGILANSPPSPSAIIASSSSSSSSSTGVVSLLQGGGGLVTTPLPSHASTCSSSAQAPSSSSCSVFHTPYGSILDDERLSYNSNSETRGRYECTYVRVS